MTATNDHEPAWFSEWSLTTSARRKSTSRSFAKPRQGPAVKSQGTHLNYILLLMKFLILFLRRDYFLIRKKLFDHPVVHASQAELIDPHENHKTESMTVLIPTDQPFAIDDV